MNATRYALLIAIAVGGGCGEKTSPPAPGVPSHPKPQAVTKLQPDAATTQVPPKSATLATRHAIEDPPVIGQPQEAFNFPHRPLEIPAVLLTAAETQNSLIKAGDTFPDLSLPDQDGKPQQFAKLMGPKLTVVVFWNSTNPYAVEQIGDMGPVIGERFGPHGVKIVGVSAGPAADAKATLQQVGATFVNLLDVDGEAFEQVATADLPRTYLLDANRKVLWFDLEYSRSTRRDLVRGIQCALLKDR